MVVKCVGQARWIAHCGIHRLLPQGWLKGGSATSAEQLQNRQLSILGCFEQHYSTFSGGFLPENMGHQLNAMQNISMFQSYFLYIHSDAHCLLAYAACSCHAWVALPVVLESYPIAHFLVATFKTENIMTSVLLSQCSHQGSAPVLLYKYC